MKTTPPFILGGAGDGAKRVAPAVARNRDAIVAVLRDILPTEGTMLEIASGTGEHVVHFARSFRTLMWQPTDPDDMAIASIAAWALDAGLPNIREPMRLDAATPDWPVDAVDGILCINMVHISPWDATIGLFQGASQRLREGGKLYLYGPYFQDDVKTAPSNLAFDQSLRSRNPDWGLRTVDSMTGLAAENGFSLSRVVAMPANNLSLIFHKMPVAI
jgi:hypothetical protein